MSWLRTAQDDARQAFLDWAKAEGGKFSAMRSLLAEETLNDLQQRLEQEKDPQAQAQLQAEIDVERSKPYTDKLKEIDATRPVFVTVPQEGYPKEAPKTVMFGEPKVNIAFLHNRAKAFGLSDADAVRAVKEFMDWFEHEMKFPVSHRPWRAPTKEEQREELRRMKRAPGKKYMPGTPAVERPTLPESQIVEADPLRALQRPGRPWDPEAAPPAAEQKPTTRLPELQKKVETILERLRKRLKKRGVPMETMPEEQIQLPPEDLPKSVQEREADEMAEIKREMIEEGLASPTEETPETLEDLSEMFQKMVKGGSIKIRADGSIEVAPEVMESLGQEEVGRLVQELAKKVGR